MTVADLQAIDRCISSCWDIFQHPNQHPKIWSLPGSWSWGHLHILHEFLKCSCLIRIVKKFAWLVGELRNWFVSFGGSNWWDWLLWDWVPYFLDYKSLLCIGHSDAIQQHFVKSIHRSHWQAHLYTDGRMCLSTCAVDGRKYMQLNIKHITLISLAPLYKLLPTTLM